MKKLIKYPRKYDNIVNFYGDKGIIEYISEDSNGDKAVTIKWSSGSTSVIKKYNNWLLSPEEALYYKNCFVRGNLVVRNPDVWNTEIYGKSNQDFYNGKPDVGVIEMCFEHTYGVRWKNKELFFYSNRDLLPAKTNNVETSIVLTQTDTKIKGSVLVVGDIIPMLKSGKKPIGEILYGKISKAIVVSGNLKFREVMV